MKEILVPNHFSYSNLCIDDASMMVLCIASITVETSLDDELKKEYNILVTDGWYHIPIEVDAAFIRLIEKGKLFVGMKIFIVGAKVCYCKFS